MYKRSIRFCLGVKIKILERHKNKGLKMKGKGRNGERGIQLKTY